MHYTPRTKVPPQCNYMQIQQFFGQVCRLTLHEPEKTVVTVIKSPLLILLLLQLLLSNQPTHSKQYAGITSTILVSSIL